MGNCVVDGWTAPTRDDSEGPTSGEAFGYLVQSVSAACGPGTLGFGAQGAERVNNGVACAE